MRSGDFRANSYVRQVFARNWLETEGLSANVVNGILYMRGIIRYLPARRAQVGEVTSEFLFKLESELKGVPGIKRVRWQLENWERDETGAWTPLTEEGRAAEERLEQIRRAEEQKRTGAPGAIAPPAKNPSPRDL
jgi:hypothetical protein